MTGYENAEQPRHMTGYENAEQPCHMTGYENAELMRYVSWKYSLHSCVLTFPVGLNESHLFN